MQELSTCCDAYGKKLKRFLLSLFQDITLWQIALGVFSRFLIARQRVFSEV
jgi:hypothetical protein